MSDRRSPAMSAIMISPDRYETMSMSIAFVVWEFPLLSETFILNLITGLIDRGQDVDHQAVESHSGFWQGRYAIGGAAGSSG